MRRLLIIAAVLAAFPAAAEAQPRLMVGGGFSAPNGDFSDVADPGYHLKAALQVGIPTLPVGLRGDGTLHRLGASDAAFEDSSVLEGSLSLVFMLPGVGVEPYFLAGVGTYGVEAGPAGTTLERVTDRGYHGGFGVVLGGLGLGAFAEVRYVQISSDSTIRLIPLTVGLRF